MLTKHFFKILITFSMMIIFGLTGVFLAGYIKDDEPIESNIEVAN